MAWLTRSTEYQCGDATREVEILVTNRPIVLLTLLVASKLRCVI